MNNPRLICEADRCSCGHVEAHIMAHLVNGEDVPMSSECVHLKHYGGDQFRVVSYRPITDAERDFVPRADYVALVDVIQELVHELGVANKAVFAALSLGLRGDSKNLRMILQEIVNKGRKDP